MILPEHEYRVAWKRQGGASYRSKTFTYRKSAMKFMNKLVNNPTYIRKDGSTAPPIVYLALFRRPYREWEQVRIKSPIEQFRP